MPSVHAENFGVFPSSIYPTWSAHQETKQAHHSTLESNPYQLQYGSPPVTPIWVCATATISLFHNSFVSSSPPELNKAKIPPNKQITNIIIMEIHPPAISSFIIEAVVFTTVLISWIVNFVVVFNAFNVSWAAF